jgi:hypothetical protein
VIENAPLRDHRTAVDWVLRWVVARESGIDAEVLAGIEECVELAPLHNPANLKGIRAARALLGEGVPDVATPPSTLRCPRSATCTAFPTSTTAASSCGATASTAPRTATSPTATASCAASRASR